MDRPEELIESYLTHKLTPLEVREFENTLFNNSTLLKEVRLQSSIIESIKKARATELKATLSKIKIDSASFFTTQRKISISMAIIGTLLLLYYLYPEKVLQEKQLDKSPVQAAPAELRQEKTIELNEKETAEKIETKSTISEKVVVAPSAKKLEPAQRTPIEALDPSKEFESGSSVSSTDLASVNPSRNVVSISNIVVENDESDKRYTFHYKFHQGKLILYGSFDSSLYEILEINGETRSVFLYYKEHFYLLNEKQNKIKMLQPIRDTALLEKLTEYRLSKK
jgi:hypothetical protein